MRDDGFAGSPLIRRKGGDWTVPQSDSWTNESSLQELLSEHPGLMPGVDEAAATVRELSIRSVGRVDVVAVEANGEITVCEVKLARNPEVRRHVVGQLFAYASALASWTFPDLDDRWRSQTGVGLLDAVLGSESDPAEREELAANIGRTLSSGSFRLVLAVDELTEELRRTIGYLAGIMRQDVDLVGLEIAYADHEDVEVIVPRSYGAELNRTVAPAASTTTRVDIHRSVAESRAGVVADASSCDPGFGVVVGEVLDILEPRVDHLYYGSDASQSPVISFTEPVAIQPLKIVVGESFGLRLCLGWTRELPIEVRRRLRDQLAATDWAGPHLARTTTSDEGLRKRPLLPYAGGLEQPGAAKELAHAILDALDGVGPDGPDHTGEEG